MTKTDNPSRRHVIAGTAAALAAATGLLTPAARAQASDGARQTVLITGSSTGIGRASALHFAKAGWHVLASMRSVGGHNAEAAGTLIQTAADQSLSLDVVEIDVTDDESVETGVAEAARLTGGRIDVLVNNAGIMVPFPVELATPDAVAQSFNTNLYGPQRMVRAVAPLMRERQSGVFVNISSGVGLVAFPVIGVYSSTKHALEGWSDGLKHELIPFGIDVVAVQPRDTETPFLENAKRYYREELARLDQASDRFRAYAEHLPKLERSLVYRNPDDVSVVTNAIFDLATQPHGQRPNRVQLGAEALDPINAIRDGVRQQVVGNSAFAEWVSL